MKRNFVNLTIIIVSFNVKEKLKKCLSKIVNRSNTEIIIIDNNSTDGTQSYLRSKLHKTVRVYRNRENIGFSKAVNQGINKAKGKLILLLNPDTEPINKAIDLLIPYALKRNVGLVGGKMIKPGSKLTHGTYVNKPNFLTGVFEFTNLKKVFPENKFSKSFYYKGEKNSKPKIVYGLSGGFLMFRKELIKRAGCFDEKFFMYLEDIDLGLRVRKMGFNNYFIPLATIIHDSGSSSSSSQYSINVKAWRNSRNYFFKKNFTLIEWVILKFLFFLDDIFIDTLHILQGRPLT